MTALPVLVFFMLAQRHFVKGLAQSGPNGHAGMPVKAKSPRQMFKPGCCVFCVDAEARKRGRTS